MKIDLSGNAPIEVFPFVSVMHCDVVLRHHDGESQDIALTPDEADHIADLLKDAATRAREEAATSSTEQEALVTKVLVTKQDA